jgi:hypothetical protein
MPDTAPLPDRKAAIRAAWRGWLIRFVPAYIAMMVLILWTDINPLPVVVGGLAIVLLYQRFINKRSWRAIMLGVYARDKDDAV